MKGKIQFITRTGTGVAPTPSSPLSMTFNFAPTLVVFLGEVINGGTHMVYSNGSGLAPQTLTTSFKNLTGISFGNASIIQWKKSSDGKTLYWHIGNNASGYEAYAGNTSGVTYFFYCLA